jgi:hypothetical protein
MLIAPPETVRGDFLGCAVVGHHWGAAVALQRRDERRTRLRRERLSVSQRRLLREQALPARYRPASWSSLGGTASRRSAIRHCRDATLRWSERGSNPRSPYGEKARTGVGPESGIAIARIMYNMSNATITAQSPGCSRWRADRQHAGQQGPGRVGVLFA